MDILQSLSETLPPTQPIIWVCIGTDRSTGDSYGPLIGTFLQQAKPSFPFLGTLAAPVHAVTLPDAIAQVRQYYKNYTVVAIDACLGKSSHVGKIQCGVGPLQPGAGVHKKLESIGDYNVTAVVNVGGCMEYFVLQNTRLNLVYNMARATADAILAWEEGRQGMLQVASS